jgi:transposase
MTRITMVESNEKPNPEVVAKPRSRSFTAEYKRRILQELDACKPGEQVAVLRREGIYASYVSTWRHQRKLDELGAQAALRGRPAKDPLVIENEQLKRENQRLQARLRKADLIIDVQKKISQLLDIQQPTEREILKGGSR